MGENTNVVGCCHWISNDDTKVEEAQNSMDNSKSNEASILLENTEFGLAIETDSISKPSNLKINLLKAEATRFRPETLKLWSPEPGGWTNPLNAAHHRPKVEREADTSESVGSNLMRDWIMFEVPYDQPDAKDWKITPRSKIRGV